MGMIDTSTLSPEEQARVASIARVIERPREGTVPIGADMVEYRVELHPESGPDRTVAVVDDMDPDNARLRSIRELIDIINSR